MKLWVLGYLAGAALATVVIHRLALDTLDGAFVLFALTVFGTLFGRAADA